MSKEVLGEITVHGKTYKLPENPVWHEGPPPEIGWWPTWEDDHRPNQRHLRYFNGAGWSIMCFPEENSDMAGFQAETFPATWSIKQVKWTAQWWKGQQ